MKDKHKTFLGFDLDYPIVDNNKTLSGFLTDYKERCKL